MGNYNYSDELIHYGVKGMKWGVRRTKEQLGYKSKSKTSTENFSMKTHSLYH